MPQFQYPRCKKNGRVLIISINTFDDDARVRSYNQEDVASVSETFRNLDYEVKIFDQNPTKKELLQIIRGESMDESLGDYSAFICVLLTRCDHEQAYGRDGPFPLEAVFNLFKSDVASHLAGKPKLFFVSTVGSEKMRSSTSSIQCDSVEFDSSAEPPPPDPSIPVPSEADILIMYSNVPGFASYKKRKSGGTRFIEGLCDAVARYGGEDMDVMRVLTRAVHSVAVGDLSGAGADVTRQKNQVPQIVSTLTKEFYL